MQSSLKHCLSDIIQTYLYATPTIVNTDVALVGGGAYPQPGEISLSHNGVLFLDELPEFKRGVLEVMCQPLEDRKVTISRAKFTVTYPASYVLIFRCKLSDSILIFVNETIYNEIL